MRRLLQNEHAQGPRQERHGAADQPDEIKALPDGNGDHLLVLGAEILRHQGRGVNGHAGEKALDCEGYGPGAHGGAGSVQVVMREHHAVAEQKQREGRVCDHHREGDLHDLLHDVYAPHGFFYFIFHVRLFYYISDKRRYGIMFPLVWERNLKYNIPQNNEGNLCLKRKN